MQSPVAGRFRSSMRPPASFPVRLGLLSNSNESLGYTDRYLPSTSASWQRDMALEMFLSVWLLCFSGVISGMLWNAGNIASIYAVQPPLGFAVGYPVTQVCTLLDIAAIVCNRAYTVDSTASTCVEATVTQWRVCLRYMYSAAL